MVESSNLVKLVLRSDKKFGDKTEQKIADMNALLIKH